MFLNPLLFCILSPEPLKLPDILKSSQSNFYQNSTNAQAITYRSALFLSWNTARTSLGQARMSFIKDARWDKRKGHIDPTFSILCFTTTKLLPDFSDLQDIGAGMTSGCLRQIGFTTVLRISLDSGTPPSVIFYH